MRILFITHKFYPDIGGIEVNSEILASAFHQAGHTVTLITWTAQPGEKQFPFTVIRQPDTSALFREHQKAEVVFENNPSLRLSWPALFFSKVHVVALRTWINRMDGRIALPDRLKYAWLKRATAVIAVSEAIRKRTWQKAVVIGNPYRNELFRVLPNTERKQDFVFMGRLVSDKGADIAIEALAILAQDNILKTLTIIGNGPEMEKLKNLVNERNLQQQVTFTGALSGEALVERLNDHQYLLVPSVWEEPFGNVALEGMASGCLPIVSDGGGLPDAVGRAGLVVERGNAAALATALKQLLTQPGLEQQLRSQAQLHLNQHTPHVVAQHYLTVVENAAKSKSAS